MTKTTTVLPLCSFFIIGIRLFSTINKSKKNWENHSKFLYRNLEFLKRIPPQMIYEIMHQATVLNYYIRDNIVVGRQKLYYKRKRNYIEPTQFEEETT